MYSSSVKSLFKSRESIKSEIEIKDDLDLIFKIFWPNFKNYYCTRMYYFINR